MVTVCILTLHYLEEKASFGITKCQEELGVRLRKVGSAYMCLSFPLHAEGEIMLTGVFSE